MLRASECFEVIWLQTPRVLAGVMDMLIRQQRPDMLRVKRAQILRRHGAFFATPLERVAHDATSTFG